MKIAVCIKQVPTREWQPRLTDDRTWVRDQDLSYEMNEPDAYALEEALRLKEKHGGEVVVVSAGPARVQQVIREALARGADRAIHVQDDALARADAAASAAAVADAIRGDGFEVVLTGLQSDDQGHAQFGPALAERLGMPHSTIIMEVQIGDGTLRAKRELEGGWFQYRVDAAAGAAHHPERHQPAALRHVEGHHGRQEEGDSRRRAGGPGGPTSAGRGALDAAEGETDGDDSGGRRPRRRGNWCGGCAKRRGSCDPGRRGAEGRPAETGQLGGHRGRPGAGRRPDADRQAWRCSVRRCRRPPAS